MTRRTRPVLIVMLGVALLQGAGCTNDRSRGTAAGTGGSKAGADTDGAKPPAGAAATPPAAARPEPPATLTDDANGQNPTQLFAREEEALPR